MARRIALPFGLLALICGLFCATPCCGQVPVVPERCTGSPHPRKTIITWRKVVIERVDFDGPIHLSQSEVAQGIKEANRIELNADDPQWINRFAEIGLRGLWQDRGFSFASVTAEAHSLSRSSSTERFLVTAHVEEGLQYRLTGIRFSGDGAGVPEAKLRGAIPIADGETFNVSRIREGIESLTKLYGSLGYIDFTAVPDTEPDDGLISVVFYLDLQPQFRVGRVEILTVDPKLEEHLRSLVRPGEIFNSVAVEEFINQNKSALPPNVSFSDDVHIDRNRRTGIVNLGFDFRVCR